MGLVVAVVLQHLAQSSTLSFRHHFVNNRRQAELHGNAKLEFGEPIRSSRNNDASAGKQCGGLEPEVGNRHWSGEEKDKRREEKEGGKGREEEGRKGRSSSHCWKVWFCHHLPFSFLSFLLFIVCQSVCIWVSACLPVYLPSFDLSFINARHLITSCGEHMPWLCASSGIQLGTE